jgi:hypothetical protein
MKIRNIYKTDIPALIEFNHRMYPNQGNIDELLNFKLNINTYKKSSSESIIAVTDEDEIIGQILVMPNRFRYRGVDNLAYWSTDFIVDKKHRSSMAGILLPREALKLKNHFGVGVSDATLAIHMRFGEKIIGHLYKYIKILNPLSFIGYYLPMKERKLKYKDLKNINTKISRFVKVQDPTEILSNNGYWCNNVLEFARDVNFLNWRFFLLKNKYHVYKYVPLKNINDLNSNTSYFVVRPIVWKKVKCLLLVDYRVSSYHHFSEILKATTKLAKILKLSAIITGCSLRPLMKILSYNYFFVYGKKMNIITNYSKHEECNGIESDNIFLTFGDSDTDFQYNEILFENT